MMCLCGMDVFLFCHGDEESVPLCEWGWGYGGIINTCEPSALSAVIPALSHTVVKCMCMCMCVCVGRGSGG